MALPTPPAILKRDLRLNDPARPPSDYLLQIYAWMYLSRTVDNRILELFRQGLIKGTVTGAQGNEGLIAPLALLADKALDVVCFSHRGLPGHLIWSDHLCDHLNQYFANAKSPTKAREGNIHHGDPKNRSLPMISHLGIMVSNIIGTTDSQRRLGRPAVGFTFFGDGASSTGDIHESLNLASLLSIPVIFVIENNGYAYSTPTKEQYVGNDLWTRAAGYGIEGHVVDATDVEATTRLLAATIDKVRATSRPVLVEAKTLRLRGHAAYDTCDYLRPGESDGFFACDPVPKLRAKVVAGSTEAKIAAIEAEMNAFIEGCIKISLPTPRPTADGLESAAFAPVSEPLPWVPSLDSKPDPKGKSQSNEAESLTMAQALNRGLRKILTERPESLILGQDIGTYGGAFKVTEGLLNDFGRPRVLNTPLAESACTGYAIGLALNGHRPIEEFQFADFVTEATTQITLNAATFYFRSGAPVPVVFRLPCGGGLTFGSFHSQELESLLLSMPGIKGLYPSTGQDAFNALLAAYEDNNPVILFEHKGLYRRGKHPVKWDPDYRSAWQPRLVRKGDYATLVTYGEMVHLAEEAAAYFEAEYGRTLEVIDLRCLAPLNLDSIRASVGRTHRLIVLHEGRRTHGFGAELVAKLTEELFFAFEAPPLRIASMDLPVPFAPELEQAFRPNREKIIEQIANWMG